MTDLKYLVKAASIFRRLKDKNLDDFADSFSNTQYRSKKWLTDKLTETVSTYKLKADRILILGGWYGSYLVPLLQDLKPKTIILNDKNPYAIEVAMELHGSLIEPAFFNVEKNPEHISLLSPDIVINTSCEHMFDMKNITTKNKNTFFAFQSCNNTNDPGHINVAYSSDDLHNQSGLDELLYKGSLDLGHKKRFMVMGFSRGFL